MLTNICIHNLQKVCNLEPPLHTYTLKSALYIISPLPVSSLTTSPTELIITMPFTPVHSFVGALLLHLSTSQILEDTGRVFGISGIVSGAVLGGREGWRWAVVSGLVAGPALAAVTGVKGLFPGQGLSALETIGKGKLALAGLLVGLGSRVSYPNHAVYLSVR